MIPAFVFMAIGLVALAGGADILVRGASRLAMALGISPLVVGLTIVAMGTSAPELSVSIAAAISGSSDIALGNIVGSNIANIGLIMGVAALFSPVAISPAMRPYFPVMIAAMFAVPAMGIDGRIGRIDGTLLVAAAIAYMVWMVRRPHPEGTDEPSPDHGAGFFHSRFGYVVMIVAGLAALVLGSKLLVDGATTIARGFGISERVIGLTLVAVGTSLPELATSIAAALRGNAAIAVGNVLGSNIANVFAILGPTALIQPIASPRSPGTTIDAAVMIGFAAVFAVFAFAFPRIGRVAGGVFLAAYTAYCVFLFV
ncbi:MAG: calcium/sodium antiporter [Deltaproteobacteria bacterium]|nr:calcium/sodium antiporter [Deltaproteobacteria bacterium]